MAHIFAHRKLKRTAEDLVCFFFFNLCGTMFNGKHTQIVRSTFEVIHTHTHTYIYIYIYIYIYGFGLLV